jgi:hypothetical protein
MNLRGVFFNAAPSLYAMMIWSATTTTMMIFFFFSLSSFSLGGVCGVFLRPKF